MPRDPRVYITVHEGMPDHPKIEGLSDGAFRLLVTAWCWCSRNLTDGFIPDASWSKRGTARSRQKLVEVGLVEVVSGGVRMHDYTEHQRTADEVADLRSKRADAGRKGGQTTAAKRVASARANAKQVLKQTGSKVQADTETDTEKEKDSSSKLDSDRENPDRFDEFWKLYPRKDSKQGAQRKLASVLKRTEFEIVMAGVRRYIDHLAFHRTDKQFIKLPTTWLHNGCWEDEYDALPTDLLDDGRRPAVDEYHLYN